MANLAGSVGRRTEDQIEHLAELVRYELGIGHRERLAVKPLLEFALDEMVDDAYFTVVPDGDLNGAEARTDWHQPVITLAASTYAALKRSNRRARMTIAHELGHLLMHCRQPVYHYRAKSRDKRVNPEWQADFFAGALLMPRLGMRMMRTVTETMETFGVSYAAALARARVLKHALVDDTIGAGRKKKGSSQRRTP